MSKVKSETNSVNVEDDNCCYTQLRYKKCSFKWIIGHYSVHAAREESLKSSTFSAPDDDFMWHAELLFYETSPSAEIKSLVFRLLPDNSSDMKKYFPVSGDVKFSVMKSDNSEVGIKRQSFLLQESNPYTLDCASVEFIEKPDLPNDWLSGDTLTVLCEVSYVKTSDIINISTSEFPNEYETADSSFSQFFKRLFMDKKFSDVTISLPDKQYYPAHKVILSARSSVFEAMFKDDMKKEWSSIVKISNMDCEVFEDMMRYIYTGAPNSLKESDFGFVFGLLGAADKFDLKELRNMCEIALCKKLSIDNALDMLVLAEKHQAKRLKMHILQFIRMQTHTHGKNVMDSKVWTVLITSYPHLVKEIMAVLVKE